MVRTASEIAGQAIVYGALGFRASLEVTDHPRTRELSSQLFPWLGGIGLGDRIEPLHREILETAHGQLPPNHRTEAYWCGESAVLLGWAIQLFETPDPRSSIDPGQLVDRLKLLQPDAAILLAQATLRSKPEIDSFCVFCLAVRNRYQQLSAPNDAASILDVFLRNRMAELGISDADTAIQGASVFAAQTIPPPRGLYVVRALAAEWLLENEGENGRDSTVDT